jgi:hypothetical protein
MLSSTDLPEISYKGRRLTFVFTVRRDGKAWLAQDSHGATLGRLLSKDATIQSARRAAILMSETGVRVIVMLEDLLGEFDPIFVAEPLPRDGRPAFLS